MRRTRAVRPPDEPWPWTCCEALLTRLQGPVDHTRRCRFCGTTLFDRVARAVCEAGYLPRKELYEAWEVARRVRRGLRGGRVVDLGADHGLLAHLMLILDDTSPHAFAVDLKVPCLRRGFTTRSCAAGGGWRIA